MGSSNEANIKAIDASVGGLVWVRRRNGSWWPGRILGLKELSESCLVTPKSGTPVKLLGREDASIDWYNLEKSKRVKAFRCGEYNECIEKAKAAAANSSKKVVKYVRREDAIIHALELESICLGGQNCLNFGYKNDISGGELETSARDSSSISNSDEAYDEMAAARNSSDLEPELDQSCSSFEESANVNSCKMQSRRTPNDSEDDGTEGVQRMRGLEDLGLSRVSNGKVHSQGQLELVRQDDALPDESNPGNVFDGKIINGGKVNSLSTKRKRSRMPIVHEFSKRRFRRRTLMKVLESTSMVSVPVVWDELPNLCCSPLLKNELKDHASTEMNITSVSRDNGVSLNDDEANNDLSGGLFDVPFIGEDYHSLVSCTSVKSVVGFSQRKYWRSSQAGDEHLRTEEAEHLRTEEMDESDSTSVGGALRTNLNQRIEKGSSKWQLKRKRNSRQMSRKRRQVGLDEEIEGEPCTRRQETISAEGSQRLLHRQLRPLSVVHSTTGLDRNIDSSDSSLFDVKLEVRASYRPQHVALVSLTSKLNGKPIVGHPLTVEILEDGHSNSFFSRTESAMEGDENSLQSKQSASQPRIPPGKSTKTKGQLTKKTRKLSTLTGRNHKEDDRKSTPGKPGGRDIVCIPLKVVFGRISEAVDGRVRLVDRPLT